MSSLSIWHWLIVLVVVVLTLGTKRHGAAGTGLEDAVLRLKKKLGDPGRPGNIHFWIKVVVGAILFWGLLVVAERIVAR